MEKLFKCETCDYKTDVKCNLERHKARKHLAIDDAPAPAAPAPVVIVVPDTPLDYSFEGQALLFEKTHCKIINKGVFIKTTEDNHIILPETMLKTAYSHLYYEEPVYKNGVFAKNVRKPFIKRWLSCEHNIRKYDDMGLYPPPMVCPAHVFNIWKPFAMDRDIALNIPYVENKEGLKAFLDHTDILCNHQKDVTDYIIYWLAQMTQYPAKKTIMPTFFGGQGGGKTSWFDVPKKMFGKEKVFETSEPSRDVWGQFNPLMATSFLVVLSELSKKETIEAENKIKALVTDTDLTINTKGVNSFQVYSPHRFSGTTNNPDILTTREGDRRNLIIHCSDEKKGNHEYFKKWREYMDDYNTLRTIWNYLKNIKDMDKFGDIPLPNTEHQQNLKVMYRAVPDLWLENFTRRNQDQPATVKLKGYELFEDFKFWRQQHGYVFETNASKLVLALKTLDITCPTTKRRAISDSKHTNEGEQREYDIEILKKHYKVGCQIVL